MKLITSEEKNPQDYFMQSGVDEQGNPIYDLLHQFINDYLPSKAIRKKVFDGNADIVISADTIHIYWKGDLVAQAQLEAQVEIAPGVWQGQLFSFADANIQKITEMQTDEGPVPITPFYRAYEVKDVPALGITNAVFGMDVHWAFKNTKLSFYLDAPGFNSRIRWQCRVKDSAVYQPPVYSGVGRDRVLVTPAQKGLQFNAQDYEGQVNHGSQADPEPGWTQHWWTFEPDGKQIDIADARTPLERYQQGVGLVVDPYLSVDEQATYFDIAIDGALISFLRSATSENWIFKVFDPSKTTAVFYSASVFCSDGVDAFFMSYDSSMQVDILENTSNRAVIRFIGRLDKTSGASSDYLTNSGTVELIFTVYPDRMTSRMVWKPTGTVSIDFIVTASIDDADLALTSPNAVYENSGSESNAADDTEYNSADYIGILSTELNVQIIRLSSDWATPTQYVYNDTDISLGDDDSSYGSGTYTDNLLYIFDSVTREGSAKIYNSTDRLAMGDQYKDPFIEEDLLGGELVLNSDFSSYSGSDPNVDFANWTEQENSGGADWNYADSACEIDITSQPTNFYDIGINQQISVEANTVYKCSFTIKGDSGAPVIQVSIYETVTWQGIALYDIWPDGNYNSYSFYFNSGQYTTVRPTITFGFTGEPQAGDTMWIRSISVKKASPTKGNYVGDLIFPAEAYIDYHPLNYGGTLHSDGAHQYEVDANDEVKVTLDIDRIRPAFVIHDWPFQYGDPDSPTSILLNHLKMDDNAASNTLLAEVGPNGSWHVVSTDASRNTSNDSVTTGIRRGRGLDTKDTYYGKLAAGSGTVHDNDYFIKGSALITISPQYAYTDSADQPIFSLLYGPSDFIALYYEPDGPDYFEFQIEWNSTTYSVTSPAYTENYSLQRLMTFLIAWDSDKNFGMLALDGQVLAISNPTATPTSNHPTALDIGGSYAMGPLAADNIIDEVKTFSEVVLPYGAYFIGNGEGLLADIDNPHADLCFFWDAQSVNAKGGSNLATSKTGTLGSGNTGGTTSFPTSGGIVGGYFDNESTSDNLHIYFTESSEDIIDYNKGTIGIWFNYQTLGVNDVLFYVEGTGTNYIRFRMDDANNIDVQYTSNGTNEIIYGNIAITAGTWHWLTVRWDDTYGIASFIDGVENGTRQAIANTWTGGTGLNLYFGSDSSGYNCGDVLIGRVFISNELYTPEIWTAFGKPLHTPLTILG